MFFKVDKTAFLKSAKKILAKKSWCFHHNHVDVHHLSRHQTNYPEMW